MSKARDGAAGPLRNKGFCRAATGATAIEYALIACLVSVFVVGAMSMTGNALTMTYNILNNAMITVVGN